MDLSIRSSMSDQAHDKHFESLDFDDQKFFQTLGSEYAKLRGPFRLISAQTLQRITIVSPKSFGGRCRSGSCSKSCQPLRSLHSPGLLIESGISEPSQPLPETKDWKSALFMGALGPSTGFVINVFIRWSLAPSLQ
jgi:hypothetical protein